MNSKMVNKLLDIISHKGNKNTVTINYHFTPTRMAKIKKTINTKCWQGVRASETHTHC